MVVHDRVVQIKSFKVIQCCREHVFRHGRLKLVAKVSQYILVTFLYYVLLVDVQEERVPFLRTHVRPKSVDELLISIFTQCVQIRLIFEYPIFFLSTRGEHF
jgi:hypothetical protein